MLVSSLNNCLYLIFESNENPDPEILLLPDSY